MSGEVGAVNGWKPKYNPWLIAIAVTLAAFMEILDTTIVNVALPYIAGTLAASSDEATYALTAYLVANGIVLTVAAAGVLPHAVMTALLGLALALLAESFGREVIWLWRRRYAEPAVPSPMLSRAA